MSLDVCFNLISNIPDSKQLNLHQILSSQDNWHEMRFVCSNKQNVIKAISRSYDLENTARKVNTQSVSPSSHIHNQNTKISQSSLSIESHITLLKCLKLYILQTRPHSINISIHILALDPLRNVPILHIEQHRQNTDCSGANRTIFFLVQTALFGIPATFCCDLI